MGPSRFTVMLTRGIELRSSALRGSGMPVRVPVAALRAVQFVELTVINIGKGNSIFH